MALDELEPLIGRWNLAVAGEAFPDDMPSVEEQLAAGAATVSFEWMEGKEFVIQRWTAPDPGPDGIAVIAADPEGDGYLQHYFDQRGVARLYEMTLESGTMKLSREEADLSPLDFSQRFTGTFSEDGNRVDGTWEITEDGAWKKDFDLVYARTE
jgi:hypothetical protein